MTNYLNIHKIKNKLEVLKARLKGVWVLSLFSCVQLFVTTWCVALQAPLSMEFSRQEYRSGLPFPSPGDLPNPGVETGCLLHWQADSLPLAPQKTGTLPM